MDKKFFVVRQDGSGNGVFKAYDSFAQAVEAATSYVHSNPTRSYYVARAEALVESTQPPVIVRPLL